MGVRAPKYLAGAIFLLIRRIAEKLAPVMLAEEVAEIGARVRNLNNDHIGGL